MKQPMRNRIVAASAIGALGLASLTGAGVLAAHAATSTGQASLVDQIAQRFNLQKADVQKVFDDNRASHETDRAAAEKARLDQAVKDGKLTRAQEDLLIAKHKEMRTLHDSLKDTSEADREAALKQAHDEYQQWAKDNSIPAEFAGPGGGRGMHHGMMGPMHGMRDE